ncbi:putative enoyl-CoA hydratase echA12 [Frankia canadensis]|uniref:Putative enoyl-CoA hydratase echA12 n=1 Tax=Frankia canadensis TaxID=1836972 RepID=A0A2I2KSN4_9ACTN|nr:enoyl-CoA hydratase/isomerase family protein [Frankia canadensis]SNQ48660.1 putative enoyl-CoA hydratase echA12 [Frankia canadensis]SOU55950.1 putative enoyl-CoA hydratase echA12 [Frankia canadensis]
MADVEVERRPDGVTVITMNRPERLNAIDLGLVTGLRDALDGVRRDPAARVVILTGAGGAFCAGADLKSDSFTADSFEPGRGELGRLYESQEVVTGVAIALNELRQPVIAAIDGVAVGGGFGYALACDLRVASDRARFGAVFTNIGLSNLDVAVSYFLPRVVGAGRALELMLTARVIDAPTAREMGVVNDVVPPGRLLDRALELAAEITARSAFGVWMTKSGFWANVDAPSLRHAVDREYRTQALGSLHGDMHEAIEAFRAGRAPAWKPL